MIKHFLRLLKLFLLENFLVPGAGVEMDLYEKHSNVVRKLSCHSGPSARLLWDKGVEQFVRVATTLRGRV